MDKDVIYIDVEDDITAIIGKVKSSKEKIVALVPPKRIGAIQSAVNLKLVHRAAEQAKKNLVVITNNPALVALAGSAGIMVAKSLQSRPEMAEIPALEIDDEDDVIDGGELPVDEHAKQAQAMTVTDDSEKPETTDALAGAALSSKIKKDKASKSKIPNFDSFRKKLFIAIGAGVFLVVFLVWAIFFAPAARIIITAKTTDSALNSSVTLSTSGGTNLNEGTIASEVKTSTKDISIQFTATGKKDVGEKASGTIKFVPTDRSIYLNGATIPAGTIITSSGGFTYRTSAAVVFDSDAPSIELAAGKTVSVTATASGSAYNGASGTASGPSGFTTTFTNTTSGGTDKTVTVVTQSDIDKATPQISEQSDAEQAKTALIAQFGKDYIVLDSSFKTDVSEVKPSPGVDGEAADGRGSLSGKAKFSIVAVKKTEIAKYLDAYFKQKIDGRGDKKVYSNGLDKVSFADINSRDDNSYTATISAQGKIGPSINEPELKEFAKGKRFGEIQSEVESISGVENADIKFSPFWVSAAPGDINRITIEFKVNE